MRRILIIFSVGAVLALLLYFGPGLIFKNSEEPTLVINMGGTSVAAFMIDKWESVYRKEKGIKIKYASTGSTEGVTKMIENKYEIGFTHAPLTDEQMKRAQSKGGEVIQVPVVLCAVVPFYNVKELKDKPPLNFDGEVLADIFLGKIDRWNHPALKKLNEGVDLPNTPITVVHREDSSGTTLLFTDFLQGASATWKKEMGGAESKVKWRVGVGMPRTNGLAIHVKNTDGAIGYVDLLFAKSGTYGAVQNKDKTAFIHVKAENITAAAETLSADIQEDSTINLTNKPGKESYPISGGIWAVCYRNQPAASQNKISDFLSWITHDGQKYAKDRNYAPLPEGIVKRVDEKLKLTKIAGK